MRLVVTSEGGAETEGMLLHKDSAFLFVKEFGSPDKSVLVFPWPLVSRVQRIVKGNRQEVNIGRYRT